MNVLQSSDFYLERVGFEKKVNLRCNLKHGTNLIGRTATENVDIGVDSCNCSRKHCVITVTERKVIIEDFAANGTTINGTNLKKETAEIRENDLIGIVGGNRTLTELIGRYEYIVYRLCKYGSNNLPTFEIDDDEPIVIDDDPIGMNNEDVICLSDVEEEDTELNGMIAVQRQRDNDYDNDSLADALDFELIEEQIRLITEGNNEEESCDVSSDHTEESLRFQDKLTETVPELMNKAKQEKEIEIINAKPLENGRKLKCCSKVNLQTPTVSKADQKEKLKITATEKQKDLVENNQKGITKPKVKNTRDNRGAFLIDASQVPVLPAQTPIKKYRKRRVSFDPVENVPSTAETPIELETQIRQSIATSTTIIQARITNKNNKIEIFFKHK